MPPLLHIITRRLHLFGPHVVPRIRLTVESHGGISLSWSQPGVGAMYGLCRTSILDVVSSQSCPGAIISQPVEGLDASSHVVREDES